MRTAPYSYGGTLVDDALSVAEAVLRTKALVPWGHLIRSEEDLRQEWYAYVLEQLQKHDPERGSISGSVHAYWRWFWHSTESGPWKKVRDYERHELSSRLTEPDEEGLLPLSEVTEYREPDPEVWRMSDRALELIGMLPRKLHDVATLHHALGIPQSATAEHLSISRRTVERLSKAAKAHWRAALLPEGQLAA